jgi:GNAT superfamily N-acetyltransferase
MSRSGRRGTKAVTLTLRAAAPADSGPIAALHAESWRNTYRGILADAYLDGPIGEERLRLWQARLGARAGDRPQREAERTYVGLAECGGDLAGFACVLLDEEPTWGACLDNLHVRRELQGQGIGRQLLARAVQWVMAEEPGWPLHLWLYEANAGARRFYDALGSQAAGRALKHAADGAEVPSLRYVWRDLGQLLASLNGQ